MRPNRRDGVLAVLRVRHRVAAGGHDVPEDKIRNATNAFGISYRQDFDAIAALLADDPADLVRLPVAVIGTDALRSAFADYARTTRLPRSGAAGRPGMCCAPTSIPRS